MQELNLIEVDDVSGGARLLSAYAAVLAGNASLLAGAGAIPSPASPWLFGAAAVAGGLSATLWLVDAFVD